MKIRNENEIGGCVRNTKKIMAHCIAHKIFGAHKKCNLVEITSRIL